MSDSDDIEAVSILDILRTNVGEVDLSSPAEH